MAESVRIVFGDANEGIQAQGDPNGNLLVREGVVPFDNIVFEDASFVVGDSPQTHDFNAATSPNRNAVDGYIVCDGAGDIQVDISRDGISFGAKFTVKSGEVVFLDHLDIDKIRITFVSANSAYRINLI